MNVLTLFNGYNVLTSIAMTKRTDLINESSDLLKEAKHLPLF